MHLAIIVLHLQYFVDKHRFFKMCVNKKKVKNESKVAQYNL